jgi:hypothetical protein
MTLIYDEFDECWIWVEKNEHDTVLSPVFDTEEDARLWRARIANIIKGKE